MKRPVVRPLLLASLLGGAALANGPGGDGLPPAKELPSPTRPRAFYVVLEGPPAIEVAPHDPEGFRARQREIGAAQARIEAALPAYSARLVSRYSRLVNALQIVSTDEAAARLREVPGVVRVEPVPIIRRANATAVPYIGGQTVWSQKGITGKGVRVGIVDTGIDYLHADFGGPGTAAAYKSNDPTIVEPGTFPTAKVAGGVDLVGDDYDPQSGNFAVKPDPDPLDCAGEQGMDISGGHGTHVAGSVAGVGVTSDGKPYTGPYDLSPNLLSFRVGPGVAPEATLYAIKIFGCVGATTAVADALEWAVDPDGDGDISDRLDVLNLSLGGAYGMPTPTDEQAVDNLIAAGAFLAVAAGNDGDATFVTGAPGTYSQVLGVAAVTDLVGWKTLTVTSPASLAGDRAAAEGAFTKPLGQTGPVSGDLVATKPATGCGTLSNAPALKGKIAFLQRGSCAFVDKLGAVAAAGAIGAVVADNVEADEPFAMGGDGTEIAIPGVMIRRVDAEPIATALASGGSVSVVLDGGKLFPSKAPAGQLARFSSRGPRSLDLELKPEIAAPGVGIDSAGVGSGSEPRDLSGTSMATPMVAGAAALVRAAHPDETPAQVKARLMGAALPAVDATGHEANVALAGAGRLAVDRAIDATFFAHVDGEPGVVAVSFGGRVSFEPYSVTKTVTVESRSASPLTLAVGTALTSALPGVAVTASPDTLVVPPGGTGSVSVRLDVDPQALGAPPGDSSTPATRFGQARHHLTEVSGFLTLTASSGEASRVPLYGATRAAGRRRTDVSLGCSGPDLVELPIVGESAHPEPSAIVLELGAEEPKKPTPSPTDIVAIGAATNLPTAAAFGDASLFFGLAVSGEWTTPTYAQMSAVSIELDTDDDGAVDYRVFVEPYTRDMPYADVLVAQTYKASGKPVESKRFLNAVSRAAADTAPFLNGVVMLPVTAKAIGLSEGASRLRYRARTQAIGKAGELSSWATFDMEHPKVQPMGGLAINDQGLETNVYVGSSLPRVQVDRSQGPASALVLHMTNEPGQRAELVSLDPKAEDMTLSVTPPEGPVVGESIFSIVLGNAGDAPVGPKQLSLEAVGGALVGVSGATCLAGFGACVTPAIPPKASATVVVTVRPKLDAKQLTLVVKGGCASGSAEVAVVAPIPEDTAAGEAWTPSGGCACEVPPRPRSGALAWAVLGIAALVARRREPPRG